MIKELFPEGESVFRDKSLTPELFSLTLDEIDKAGEAFIGVIKVVEEESSFFLFFLKGDAYAAGCIRYGRPIPMSIKEFFNHMSDTSQKRTISLYKTDPVLFKCMLVFLQREASIKATTDIVNLENILAHIRKEQAAAVIILKKSLMYNFFFIHSGVPEIAHFSDESRPQEDLSIAEQMLLYAYPVDNSIVELLVYRDIKTSEAADRAGVKPFPILDVIRAQQETAEPEPEHVKPALVKEERPMRIRIEITEGPQKGNKFNVPLPCTIGRRDADIRIRDMTISKRHASLEASGGKIIFKDLGSTNGSIVNGKTVNEAELSDGDIIQMGGTSVRIQFVTG